MNQMINFICAFFFENLFFQSNSFNCNFSIFTYFDQNLFKQNLIQYLTLLNINFREITDNLIEIIFINNTRLLIPSSIQGITNLQNLITFYNFSYFPVELRTFSYGNQIQNLTIPFIWIPLLEKKLPETSEEINLLFNSLKVFTDYWYIDNICLDDLYFDSVNNYYIILNLQYIEPKSPYIEVRLENILNNKNIYYFFTNPITLNNIYFLRNMGGII